MDNKILKSSIKAYCRELLETSTSGDAGGYLTKKAFRKPTKKDKNSPTGFESSPKPNMYTKTMKFKIVDQKSRIDAKDLWKGEHLEEINENNSPSSTDFPITISSYEKGQVIGDWLKKYGYKVDTSKPPFLKNDFKPFTLNSDMNKNIRINEIKVNKPIYNISSLEKLYSSIPDNREREEVEDKYFSKYPGTTYLDELFPKLTKQDINQFYNELLNIKGLQESRYTQFKKSTSKPKPREILHRAIKEIQLKLDEVNRLIEFTTRIKGELQENDQEIEYLKRTKDSLYKIQDKLKEAFQNISKINEIKINNPSMTVEKVTSLYRNIKNFNIKGWKRLGDKLWNKYPESVNIFELINKLDNSELSELGYFLQNNQPK